MDLEGYGCSGFSYTEKYKKSIIDIYDYIENHKSSNVVQYIDFQRKFNNEGICAGSETRMIIPFLLKADIINKDKCIFHGSRISSLILDSDFFTHYGKCFIQYLKIDLKQFVFNDNLLAQKYLSNIGFRLSVIQFLNLCKNVDVYEDVRNFITKYKYIDKIEFYILVTFKKKQKNIDLEKEIMKYRKSEYNNYQITSNINDFQYIKAQLLQFKICNKIDDTNKIAFSQEYLEFIGDKYE